MTGSSTGNRNIAHTGENNFVGQLQVHRFADDVTESRFRAGRHAHNTPPTAVKTDQVIERLATDITG